MKRIPKEHRDKLALLDAASNGNTDGNVKLWIPGVGIVFFYTFMRSYHITNEHNKNDTVYRFRFETGTWSKPIQDDSIIKAVLGGFVDSWEEVTWD